LGAGEFVAPRSTPHLGGCTPAAELRRVRPLHALDRIQDDIAPYARSRAVAPLDTAPLFPDLHAELLALLRALELEDWERPAVAGAWRVRDVAAHLLDGESAVHLRAFA